MLKSELIKRLAKKAQPLPEEDVAFVVKHALSIMEKAILSGEGVEIRGFGCFHRRYHPPRNARNPKTGEAVKLPAKFSACFTSAKALKERLNGKS